MTRWFKREHVCYFDFECSTDGIHKAYCICYKNDDGIEGSYYGLDCSNKFLDMVPENTLCYAHNLSYDICFILSRLDRVIGDPIIHNGKTMSLIGMYHNKMLLFKDTYSIITTKLSKFPSMFHLDSGPKEVFPYDYYISSRTKENQPGDIIEASKFVREEDRDYFISNVKAVAGMNDTPFDMRKYC